MRFESDYHHIPDAACSRMPARLPLYEHLIPPKLAVCRLPKGETETYIRNVIEACQGHGGFAFGSGNSIPDYVPLDQYLCMVNCVRRLRGEDL